MLGEELGEERGQVTGIRVLPSAPGQGPRTEVSVQATGTLLGVAHTDNATYEATVLPDGTLFGEGQGVSMSTQGDVATWRGQGAGRITETGATEFRGAIYYQTTSPKWAQLNGVAAVFEYCADESGKSESRIWEWK